MKKKICMLLCFMMSISIGCVKKAQVEVTLNPEKEIQAGEEEKTVNCYGEADNDFKSFFEAYFSIDENILAMLNQSIQDNNTDYYSQIYEYKREVDKYLGNYLSDKLKTDLYNENVALYNLDLPKRHGINGYVTEASGEVIDVKINSVKNRGDSSIYEIDVTVVQEVEPADSFFAAYSWSDALGCYIPAKEEPIVVKESIPYVYAKNSLEVDKIKVIQTYWVEVLENTQEQKSFVIEGIEEANYFAANEVKNNQLYNVNHVKRIPYYDELSKAEYEKIIKTFASIMNAPEETFRYYEKIFEGEYEFIRLFWKQLELNKIVNFGDKKNFNLIDYQRAFNSTLNPYKDNIVELKVNEKGICIFPSIYSTQLQPRYIVMLPVQALLGNNKDIYYNYKYNVGFEAGKIEYIQFVEIAEITEDTFNADSNLEFRMTSVVSNQ